MNESFDKKQDSVYSKRLKAGKRRTYFFDVRSTRGNDYFLTITESRKRMADDGYDRHKIFLYKEDFHKFMKGLNEAVAFVKTELMPDFDFDSFNHEVADDTDEVPVFSSPAVATELLNKSAFGGITEVDGHAIDKAEALPGAKEINKQTQPQSSSSNENNLGTGNTEEVDRW